MGVACWCMSPWPAPLRPSPMAGGLRRWLAQLPVSDASRLPLGIGDTPLIELPRLANELGLAQLLVKDEGAQELGTWNSRGMAVAAAAHAERGATALAAPCTGSDAAALAAACHRLGLGCRVILPTGASAIQRAEARLLGARVVAVLGDHGTAQDWLASHPGAPGEQTLEPFGEPYRVEGEKTVLLEALDALGSESPEVVILPTGSGLELAAAAQAIRELREAGRLAGAGPRLVAVQVEACPPLVEAFTGRRDDLGTDSASRRTLAEDLRVPRPADVDGLVALLRASGGCAVSVGEDALIRALRQAAAADAFLLGPEGAAGLAGLAALCAKGEFKGARVLLVNPTSLHRSPETLAAASVG